MTSFEITDVYTSKPGALGTEQKYTPMIGEYYSLTVEFDVVGTPTAHYPVFFGMADRWVTKWVSDLTSSHQQVTADFFLPLDGAIPWEVDVDPYDYADGVDPIKSPMPHTFPDVFGKEQTVRVSTRPIRVAKATRTGAFEPAPPSSPIDYYGQTAAWAYQTLNVRLPAGEPVERMVAMMGSPVSASWQKVTSGTCSVQYATSSSTLETVPANDADYPVYFWEQNQLAAAQVTMAGSWVLELSNVRVDRAKLREVTWAVLDEARNSQPYTFYAAPDPVTESTDQKISDFVSGALGSNYRQRFTPYDAARALFQAVLAHTTYFYPKQGETDLRGRTAVEMVEKGLGDCGGFSLLLVASFRNIGFAARTACGFWTGLNQAHCWCELYFPRFGWVLCDGSAGNGLSESGEYAYYFGNLPDLYARFAIMRGNKFEVADVETSWLQGPDQYVEGSVPEVSSSAHTMLIEHFYVAISPAATSTAVPSQVSDDLQLAAHRCPCAEHGGFQPALTTRAPLHAGA
jgi:transglutaminase-like putative cysteine protease